MSYFNADGLLQKYGTEQSTPNVAGEYRTTGSDHEIEVVIDLTTLDQTEAIQSDVTVIPAGAFIKEVELTVQEAAATGVALDVGLIRLDRSTELDYNGLIDAEVKADIDNLGDVISYTAAGVGASSGGALIGTVLVYTGHITASATTATAFTTGIMRIKVRYFFPTE
jgi:hypothetical protein